MAALFVTMPAMPYRKTQFLAGHYYHVYNRGNNRQPIFFNADNYRYFLHQVRLYLTPCADVVAYCLMPNHYHLLLYLKKDDLSDAMQSFSKSYVQAINREQGRVGHLFQGPFQAILVDTDH